MLNRPSLQFVLSYTSTSGRYKRVINFMMFRIKDNYQMMAGFDPEAGIRLLMASVINQKHAVRDVKGGRKKLEEALGKLKEFYFLMVIRFSNKERQASGGL